MPSPLLSTLDSAYFAAHLAAQKQAGMPDWWLATKQRAWEQFGALPQPSRLDERWRFSKLSGLDLSRYSLPAIEGYGPSEEAADELTDDDDAPMPCPLTDSAAPAADSQLLPFERAATLCFHDRALVHRSHLSSELEKSGVIFAPLAEALLEHGELIRQHFQRHPAALGSEKFNALSTALCSTGALLYVPAGVEIAEPLLLEHHLGESCGFPHTLVILGERSKATLVESFATLAPAVGNASEDGAATADSAPPRAQFVSAVNELHAAPGAQLSYIGIQDWSLDTLAIHSNSIAALRDARTLALQLHVGGRQVRHEAHSRLLGPGAHSDMYSLSVAQGTQEYDQRTLQTHAAPHTSSDLLYKNALLGRAHSIFSGLIVVAPEAQQTDAYQSNRNLLLSPDAAADSLPGLEIEANDVKCTHGATSYRIDPEQLYYLRSRGIPQELANEMLVFAFFDQVMNKLRGTLLRDSLASFIQSKFKQI